VDKWTK